MIEAGAKSTGICVGICGAGQMGVAAAISFQRAGHKVLLWARKPDKHAAIVSHLAEIETWLEQNVGSSAAKKSKVELIGDLAVIDTQADVVVDCIAESMEQKVALFTGLKYARQRDTIFITTTSGLSITEMGRQSSIGPRLAGAHFWNPPHLMPLVEVIRGKDTEEKVMEKVVELVRSIDKIPVRVHHDVPGFIGNRLLHAMWREAINIVQRGIASAEDVDRVARLTFGLRMAAVGPLENMDLVGLDLVDKIHDYLLADLANDPVSLSLLKKMVKSGQRGMKDGHGFHDWTVRDPKELIERRNQQIIQQLEFLKRMNAL